MSPPITVKNRCGNFDGEFAHRCDISDAMFGRSCRIVRRGDWYKTLLDLSPGAASRTALAEETTTAMARIPGLFVTARQSCMVYKNTVLNVRLAFRARSLRRGRPPKCLKNYRRSLRQMGSTKSRGDFTARVSPALFKPIIARSARRCSARRRGGRIASRSDCPPLRTRCREISWFKLR